MIMIEVYMEFYGNKKRVRHRPNNRRVAKFSKGE